MIKVSELTGAALDWAVAHAQGSAWALGKNNAGSWSYDAGLHGALFADNQDLPGRWRTYQPSTNWAQGGPIIEREGISTRFSEKDARGAWYAVLGPNRFLSPDHEGSGPTPLIAAMRCYVASKLGEKIDIPKELT